jgi:hypothetical protein
MEQTSGAARWQARYDKAQARGQVRDADFTTLSGMPVEPVYGPGLHGIPEPQSDAERERMERIGWPGEFPFTRGLYPTGYRGRTWTIRQFAGFGNAVQTNERYKMILERGGGGLSVAFDMPTLMGRDSDDPHSLGEVGHCGVAIDSAADMEVLFGGIPAGRRDHLDDDQRVPRCRSSACTSSRPSGRASTSASSTGPCRPTSSRSTSPRRSGSSSPARTCGSSATSWSSAPSGSRHYKPLSVSGYHIREAGSDGRAGVGLHPRRRVRLRRAGALARVGHRDLRAGAVVLLRRACRLLRGDREIPCGAADLGPLDARCLRRQDRQGAVAAVPHPDCRRLADRPAALQQRRPHCGRGARRSPRRHQLIAHQRLRRDPRPADRAGRRDRPAHPAGHHARDRRRPTSPTRSVARGMSRPSPTGSRPRPRRSSRIKDLGVLGRQPVPPARSSTRSAR